MNVEAVDKTETKEKMWKKDLDEELAKYKKFTAENTKKLAGLKGD
jgi:hypothetical protein